MRHKIKAYGESLGSEVLKEIIAGENLMYPLLLKPPIKDYLWGGTKLKTDFCFETEKDIAAEAWVFSCHKDGMNVVRNGEHKGKNINEVLHHPTFNIKIH